MTRNTPERIEELLRSGQKDRRPEPPSDLLDKIKSDIPEHLELAKPPAHSRRPPLWASRRAQLLAASLFVVVVGSIVASRVLVEEPRVAIAPVAREDRASAASSAPPEAYAELAPSSTRATDVDEALDRAAAVPVGPAAPPREKVEDGREVSGEAPPELRPVDTLESTSKVGPPAVDERESARQRLVEEPESTADEASAETIVPAPRESAYQAARADDAKKHQPTRRGGADSPQAATQEQRIGASARPMREQVRVQAAPPVALTDLERVPTRDPRAAPSTGGTTEPNDRPYGDVFFDSTGVNPFIDTEDDNLSTFGLDVDTGSYTVARRYLEDGNLPPAAAIRVEEFVNYFDYRDPAPRREDFAVSIEGAPSPFAEGPRYQLLRFGIKAREVAPRERRPATLVFVVDTSGSMERGNRIELVKRALMLLLDELGRDDRVGLVEYSTRARVLLEPTRDKLEVERALRLLAPHGSTNAEEGLLLGYELADEFFRRDGINRVILCSDGVANVGRTGPDSILERIEREARRGIEITTVGFGMGNYNDVLMEQLADRGNGRYAHVDTLDEARRIFVENLTGTLETVARDAKVQVEFNPAVVSRYRLLGYENRDIADRRFRDDSVDAGEIGSGHTVTALYEVKLREEAARRGELATLHLRWESIETRRVHEIDQAIRVYDLQRSWRKASTSLRLASVVAEFAEILKGSYWARDSSLEDLLARAERLADEVRDADVSELVGLVERAARLERERRTWDD